LIHRCAIVEIGDVEKTRPWIKDTRLIMAVRQLHKGMMDAEGNSVGGGCYVTYKVSGLSIIVDKADGSLYLGVQGEIFGGGEVERAAAGVEGIVALVCAAQT